MKKIIHNKKEIIVNDDCFAYSKKFGEAPKCSALKKINCKNCNFYKNKEAHKEELKKLNNVDDLEAALKNYQKMDL